MTPTTLFAMVQRISPIESQLIHPRSFLAALMCGRQVYRELQELRRG